MLYFVDDGKRKMKGVGSLDVKETGGGSTESNGVERGARRYV